MKSFNCPSCGAQIDFRSAATLYAICAYCQSVVVRNELDVELIGKVAHLQEDSSPFMLGTQGRYRNVAFTLVGRIVRGWEDGQWNEWFMLLDDQRRAWLAEAQGQITIYFEDDAKSLGEQQSSVDQWQVGASLTVNKRSFTVTDVKQVRCVGCEGELPRYLEPGSATHSIDLTAPPNSCATIELDGKYTLVYIGEFVEFDQCHFEQLRSVPGW